MYYVQLCVLTRVDDEPRICAPDLGIVPSFMLPDLPPSVAFSSAFCVASSSNSRLCQIPHPGFRNRKTHIDTTGSAAGSFAEYLCADADV